MNDEKVKRGPGRWVWALVAAFGIGCAIGNITHSFILGAGQGTLPYFHVTLYVIPLALALQVFFKVLSLKDRSETGSVSDSELRRIEHAVDKKAAMIRNAALYYIVSAALVYVGTIIVKANPGYAQGVVMISTGILGMTIVSCAYLLQESKAISDFKSKLSNRAADRARYSKALEKFQE
ncbi:hypothetical protein [Pseudohalioglobus lutimaris]|uniref:Uncharacterized protein n=1 Tax=Pseudohalioglobus lutimaris TaxID=1737061 RepID=A0A2N5X0Y8_9GAMM|nr:hypothetical protein [Pseudohalioglobus lutimaris]PLW68162.1 hypothetical protein C0039_13280 [Pseudohalioglobus lutimaris]